MRHFTVLGVVLAAIPLTGVHAQDSLPIGVGDRVRVTAPTLDIDKYDGTIRALAGDTLTVRSLRVALMAVTADKGYWPWADPAFDDLKAFLNLL